MSYSSYTLPEVSTLLDHRIKDLFAVDLMPQELRILYLPGSFVRIDICPDDKYSEFKCYDEEIKLDKYKSIFEDLSNNFFYGDASLFGAYKDGELRIYDVYTNDNYLSLKDMMYLEKTFGLPIATPIQNGKISYEDAIEIIHKKTTEGLISKKIFILPSMYLNDKRETASTVKKTVLNKTFFGEKKVVKTWNCTATTPQTYRTTPSSSGSTSTTNNSTTATTSKVKEKKQVFTLSTKEERVAVSGEVLKRIKARMSKNEKEFNKADMKLWDSIGIKFAHMFAIHTLPSTRKLVYKYAKFYLMPWKLLYKDDASDKWAQFFIDFFTDEYPDQIGKYTFGYYDYIKISKFFKDEFEEFDKLFVKETDAKDDWRFTSSSVY